MSRRALWIERGKEYLSDIKRQSGCAICGIDDLEILDFHHRDGTDKSFNLSGSSAAKSLESLRAEVEKCVVLCANCHRRVHAGTAELPDEGQRPDEDENEPDDEKKFTFRDSRHRRHHGGH